MLKLILFCVFLHTVFSDQIGFGKSYLKGGRLCHQWTCLTSKLGLTDELPPQSQYNELLKSLLPPSWHGVASQVVDKCYNDRPRRYTNTCPGQALLHCTVDQLIQFCPEEYLKKDDACTPVTGLAGFKYMFSQSRYENLERNLPSERRPVWFLRNYFNSKCCDLPTLLNSTVLEGCGFSSVIHYHDHGLKYRVVARKPNVQPAHTPGKDEVKIVNINKDEEFQDNDMDPMDCCDLSGFVDRAWKEECDFKTTWSERFRITIKNKTRDIVPTASTVSTTTVSGPKVRDVKVIPQTCEKETCVFRKLNIINENGTVDLDAFSKLLDNMTSVHEPWVKAKARVVTKCLTRRVVDYVDSCEINRVLSCTFDILSENCPFSKGNDSCKHSSVLRNDIICQISSSKLRPKNRRQFCDIPSFVNHEVLKECKISSISQIEFVDYTTRTPFRNHWSKSTFACQSSANSTKCLLSKMGVLNKYGFMDYFKMKDKIRKFTSQNPEWSALVDVYLSTFTSSPMYAGQCTTTRKLLNVIDAMLMTCPMPKRTRTPQCNAILSNIANTAPAYKQLDGDKLKDFWKPPKYISTKTPYLLLNEMLPPIPEQKTNKTTPLPTKQPKKKHSPLFDFGILNSKDAPKVEIIDLKKTEKTTQKTLVLQPVYMKQGDGILRSASILVAPPPPN